MIEGWGLAILLLVAGLLLFVGICHNAQRLRDEKRRERGIVSDPDKVRARRSVR